MPMPSNLITGVTARLPGDWQKQPTEKKRTKYNAVRVEVDGYKFDSKMEAARYRDLKLMETARQIYGLEVHPQFLLQQAIQDVWRVVPAIVWKADFLYMEHAKIVVEDVKGRDTREASLKHKLFRVAFPKYELRIVRK